MGYKRGVMLPAGHLWVNGERVDAALLPQWRAGKSGILADVADFLQDWFAPESTITLHTSGSTGRPMGLKADKKAMYASAELSCRIFGLREGTTALLSLPLRYIAGKMMVVRALVAHLRLTVIEPCSTPLSAVTRPVDFAPLVPLQAIKTLQLPGGIKQWEKVHTALLGGGFLPAGLEEALQSVPSAVYASYGMTETFSHIALRRVNGTGRSDAYTPLPGVRVSALPDGCLHICAPHLGIRSLATRDLAEVLPEGCFRILGRKDAVINSGGIKIQAEEIEQRLQEATGLTLAVVPRPHPELGQCVALLWEGDIAREPMLMAACASLPRYCQPRYMRHLDTLPRTETGKLARMAYVRLAEGGEGE